MRMSRHHVDCERKNRAVPRDGFRFRITMNSRARRGGGNPVSVKNNHFGDVVLRRGIELIPDEPCRDAHFAHPPRALPRIAEVTFHFELRCEFFDKYGGSFTASAF